MYRARRIAGPLDHLPGAVDVRRDGFLAEHRQPGFGARNDQLGVGLGRRRDHERVEPHAEQMLRRVRGLEVQPPGNLAGPGGVGVGDDHGIDGGKPGQDPGVECADPPGSGKPDSHGFASGVTGWPGYPIVCAIGNRGRTVNAVNGKIGGIAGAASPHFSSRRPGGSGTPPP